jgi:ribosomal-protein-alanine N-acetyltransferase
MNNELIIREYNFEDKPKLLEILKLNVPKYFAESEIVDLNNYLDHEIDKYYVLVFENQIIGAGGINFEENNTIGKISWDFIHPDFQGIGAGTKLLKHRLEILKSMHEIKTISVRTSQLVYKFYQKNGFVLKEVINDYWAQGFDLYNMTYEQ